MMNGKMFIRMPYPNPFSFSTTKFDLRVQKEEGKFTIGLYDKVGNLVQQKIYDGNLKPETRSFTIETNNLKTGRYYSIVAKSGKFTR